MPQFIDQIIMSGIKFHFLIINSILLVPSITTLEGTVGSSKLKTATTTPSRPRLRSLDTFRG